MSRKTGKTDSFRRKSIKPMIPFWLKPFWIPFQVPQEYSFIVFPFPGRIRMYGVYIYMLTKLGYLLMVAMLPWSWHTYGSCGIWYMSASIPMNLVISRPTISIVIPLFISRCYPVRSAQPCPHDPFWVPKLIVISMMSIASPNILIIYYTPRISSNYDFLT